MALIIILSVLMVLNGLLLVAQLIFAIRLRQKFKQKIIDIENLRSEADDLVGNISSESQNIYSKFQSDVERSSREIEALYANLLRKAEESLISTCDNLQVRMTEQSTQVTHYIENWLNLHRDEIAGELARRLSDETKRFRSLAIEHQEALAREMATKPTTGNLTAKTCPN